MAEQLRWSQILFRAPVYFSQTREEPELNFLRIYVQVPGHQDRLVFSPIRRREAGNADEWYLRSEVARLNVLVGWDQPIVGGDVGFRQFTLDAFAPLTVAEVAGSTVFDGHRAQAVQLTGGELAVPLGVVGDNAWSRTLREMWPTRRASDISHLRLNPSGAHLQGVLPEGFYPDRAVKPVVLRLPREYTPDRKDFFRAGDSPRRPELERRHLWRLTTTPFPGVGVTSRSLVESWAAAVGGFRLPGDGRRALSFVDSTRSNPGPACELQVFTQTRTADGESRLDWLGTELGTRFNLGGVGTTEATFAPEQLFGTSLRAQDGPRARRTVAFETLPPQAAPAGPGDEALTLTLAENGTVTPGGRADLVALSSPAQPVVRPDTGTGAPPVSFRGWLCTETGWAAIESPDLRAEIDADKVTQGAVLGVLEIDRLISLLSGGAAASNGLLIQLQARASGRAAVTLTEPATGPRAISLRIDDPMTTVTTPRAFYVEPVPPEVEAPGPLPQAVLPSLTSQTGLTGDIPEDAVNGRVQALDEALSARFERATFVSRSVARGPTYALTEGAIEALRSGGVPAAVISAYRLIRDAVYRSETAFTAQVDRAIATVPNLTEPQRQRFRALTVQAATRDVRPLSVSVTFAGAGGSRLEFEAAAVILWHRPERLPLARTFPWRPSQDIGAFLDANRGLLPFRAAGAGDRVSVLFPSAGLPRSESPPKLDEVFQGAGPWRLAPDGRGANAFLPTLPGLELDLARAAPRWQYRHAVPTLDEAYAEAAESPEAAKDRPPLPDGFDPTRVRGAVAFAFGEAEARGWAHPTEAHPGGELPLELVSPPALEGRAPRVELRLRNHDGSSPETRTVSRTENTAGLSLPLAVTPRAGADLPPFDVALGTTAGSGGYVDHINRNGQPLLGTLDPASERVRTHDGRGVVLEQAPHPLARSRLAGTGATSARLTGVAEVTSGLKLVLVGVDLADGTATPATVPSGARAQCWRLTAATGATPRLAGFPLKPVSLALSREAGPVTIAHVGAVLLVRDAGSDPAGGAGRVELTLRKEGDGGWALAAVTGTLDWRFLPKPGELLQTRVVRLAASFKPRSAGSTEEAFPLVVDEVELEGPTGHLTTSPARGARLASGELAVEDSPDPALPTGTGFTAHVGGFTVVADQADPPEPHSVLLWATAGSGARSAELRFEDGMWSFVFRQGGTALVDTPLLSHPAGLGEVLLHSGVSLTPRVLEALTRDGIPAPVADALRPLTRLVFRGEREFLESLRGVLTAAQVAEHQDRILRAVRAGGLPLPPGAWFRRRVADLALLAASFSAPDTLASLGGDVRLLLDPVGEADKRETGLGGSLGAHLRVSARGGLSAEVAVSGELVMANQIGLLRGTDRWEHALTLTFDRAPWPTEAFFFGKAPQTAFPAPAVATHRLNTGTTEVTWTVPQPVTLRTARDYGTRFLQAAGPDDSLVVDAGWVFWLRAREEPAENGAPAGVGSPELDHPGLERRWRLGAVAAEQLEFSGHESHVVRLPFAFAGPRPTLALPTIGLGLSAREVSRVLPTPGAQMPQVAPASRPPERPSQVTFLRRGPLAYWLDPAFVGQLFTPQDREFLPAFADSGGNVSNKLPDRRLGTSLPLGDLEWLAPGAKTPARRTLTAASLRTPYVPRGEPVALDSSTLVAFPFTVQAEALTSAGEADRVDAQLLAAGAGQLTRLRRERLETAGESVDDVVGRWGRDALDELRRDTGALVLRDFTSVQPVPRGFSAARRERPSWPTGGLAPAADGASRRPPAQDPDPRRRDADATFVLDPRPEETPTVYAARPEPQEDPPSVKAVASTRFRLAAEERGRLRDARVASLTVASGGSAAAWTVAHGQLLSSTRADDLTFVLSDPQDPGREPWAVLPSAGAEVFALRDGLPLDWERAGPDDTAPRPVDTLRPPLVDVLNWARRPGELTRSTWMNEAATYSEGARAVATGPAREVTLRRPRAAPGPDEGVRLDVLTARPLVLGAFQYTRFRLTQRIARTDAPGPGDVYAVLAGKAEVFQSARTRNEAATAPAVLRAKGQDLERSSLTLVAHKLFNPRLPFLGTTTPRTRTVLLANATGDIPQTIPADALIDDLAPPSAAPWRELDDTTYVLKVTNTAPLEALLKPPPKSAFVLLVRYVKDKPEDDWKPPEEPLLALSIATIDATREFVRPKMSLAVLAAPCINEDDAGHDGDDGHDKEYSLAGYGRLEDDDFAPIQPEGVTAGRVSWTRTANLQSIDRMTDAARSAPEQAGSRYAYDVAFYGPGGELVPTER